MKKKNLKNILKIRVKKIANDIVEYFPKIGEVKYQCPACKQSSQTKEFGGNFNDAICPKCNKKFQPTVQDFVRSLYLYQLE